MVRAGAASPVEDPSRAADRTDKNLEPMIENRVDRCRFLVPDSRFCAGGAPSRLGRSAQMGKPTVIRAGASTAIGSCPGERSGIAG